MELFHIVEEGVALLRSKGVYRQVKVYRRGKDVFASHGGGFVKLGSHGGTSNPNVSWDGVEGPEIFVDRVGGQPRFGGRLAVAA